MREFGDYRIQSDEYRLVSVHQAEQIEELKNKDARRNFTVQSLQRQIAELEKLVVSKDNKIEEIEGKLDKQLKETEEWKEKFELQDLKTERAHERRMEQEQRADRLEKVVSGLKNEMEKVNCVQVFLGSQINGCRQKI
eukprot:TCONS_00046470-protein